MADSTPPGDNLNTSPPAGAGNSTKPETGNLADKKQEARLAMEGPEWTAKRETENRIQHAQAEKGMLDKRLAEIEQEKEKLELAWIELDNLRQTIRSVLNPISEEEKVVEAEEAAVEAEEAKTGVATAKHEVEKKRWAIQDKRKEIEGRKWVEEEKLAKIEQTIETNTARYRQLLDEEDKTRNRLDQLKTELAL